MCGCSWSLCVAQGTLPTCRCSCHDEAERESIAHQVEARRVERCSNCRYAAYTCSRGLCYCVCHGDRPVPFAPVPAVSPGHDSGGHERRFAHVHVFRPASPDLDKLIELRDAYAGEVHPELTIGGANT